MTNPVKEPESPNNSATHTTMGKILCVQTHMVHGVCFLIESSIGKVLVPLDAKTQKGFVEALTHARTADDSFIGSVSSLSLH